MPLPSLVGGVSPICMADEDFGQAVITGVLNWAEKYHILGTKTFQDHREIRYVFQFGSVEFIYRWGQDLRAINCGDFSKKNAAKWSEFLHHCLSVGFLSLAHK